MPNGFQVQEANFYILKKCFLNNLLIKYVQSCDLIIAKYLKCLVTYTGISMFNSIQICLTVLYTD